VAEDAPLEGLIFDIENFAVHDGPGIRTAVFMKGCPLRCLWCHNPESQSPRPELAFLACNCRPACDDCLRACPRDALVMSPGAEPRVIAVLRDRCDLCRECLTACRSEALALVGQPMTVQAVFDRVRRQESFYRHSGGGVTVTGGEPLTQWRFVRALLARCRQEGISTALDTCGYGLWEHLQALLEFTDLLLYDVKEMDSARHALFTGVPNEVILANLRRASDLGVPVAVRIPLIPGYNASAENVGAIGEFARQLATVVQIELLPYHRLGKTKYKWLDRSYNLDGAQAPPEAEVQRLRELLEAMGHRVQIGG
jgi:pyruvate formate lyase activating enzyme